MLEAIKLGEECLTGKPAIILSKMPSFNRSVDIPNKTSSREGNEKQ